MKLLGQFETTLPPRVLSPNNSSHWAIKAKAKKKQRQDFAILTKAYIAPPEPHSALLVETTWHPATLHPFDEDNALASLKSAFDGIADALGINDSKFTHKFTKASKAKGGLLIIQVYELPS